MKGFYSVIQKYLKNHKNQKRHIAVVLALSVLVSFAVPLSLIMPAISMTTDAPALTAVPLAYSAENSYMITNVYGDIANENCSPKELSEKTLLIGDGVDWAENLNTAGEVIEAAKQIYFLGIASDFSIFLENDFNPKDSDTEGRAAVGGNIIFERDWNYQIGNGDFATGTALNQTDNFSGRTNYAHVITQGGIKNINVISQGKDKDNDYLYKNDLYKRFVVSSSADLTDTSNFSHSNGNAYSQSCNHASGLVNNLNELACFYKVDLIDFTETFNWLRNQSERLARNSSTGTASVNGTVLTLDGQNKTDSTIYFSLSSWNSDINEINFVNVPDNANFVINCGGETVSTISQNTVKTTINGTVISNLNSIQTNNNVKSEQILYNLYEASSVFIDTNFNGTILAPNADVTSNDNCNGHLSGALIAKSFTGGLEFGYRPYRGTVDILGSSAGYSVPVDKFRTDGTTHLAGASFILQEALSGETYKTVDSWKSSDITDFITIPSKVDFSGDTSYIVNDTVSQDYVIREQSPPAGYIGTDDYYKISLKEQIININTDSNSKTYPKQVKTTVQITKCIQNGNSTTETPVISWVIDITDSEDSSVRDIIITESGGTPAEIGRFRLSIDSATQKITNVSSIDSNGESTAIEIDNLNKACTFALGDKSFYFDPDSLMVMPIAAESISFTNNYGLVFRKVDGSGAPLKGADIKFQEKQSDYVNVDWNWSANISSLTIDPDSLTQGTIYRFHEESPPSGYETAFDIYFMKTGDTTVKYADSEEALSVSGDILDLTNDDSRTIIMTDIQIAGAALKLKKVDSGDNTKLLSGSEFKLFAADGDVPVYPLSGTFKIETGELDLFNTLRNAAADSFAADYVQNGYLKAGSYYLKEITPPAGYTAPTEPFYFTVNKSGSAQSGYEIIAGKPQYADFTVENTSWGKEIWANGEATGVTKIEIEVETPASGSLVLYENSALNAKTADIIDGVATFTFDNPIDVTGRFKIQNTDYVTGLQVKAVRVYGGNSSSSNKAHAIKSIVWNDQNLPGTTVDKLTFYYADGTTDEDTNINVKTNEWWNEFDLSNFESKENVIGISIVVGGSGNGKLVIQASDDKLIWGNQSDQYTASYTIVTAGQTYTLGSTEPVNTETETGTEENGSISAEGMTITIANDKTGSKVSVTAEKQWENDTGYESLRPASVSIQLKRSASSDLSAPESVGEPVILNASNSWKYEWSKLDSLQEDNITPYYYFVQEISNPAGYTVSYENNSGLSSGGTVTIINRLSTRDYNVEKVWNTNNVPDVNIPESITVKLQSSADNGVTWTDVSGKTLVLKKAFNWKGKFEALPDVSNLQFRVTEVNVPNGWTSVSSTSPDGTLTVTNTIKTGSLKLRKIWQDNKDGNQSGVWVNLYRSLTPPGNSGGASSAAITPLEAESIEEDYGRLLQYSLYFYDANMCGDEVDTNSALSWRSNCHTDDAVKGGFHDAGDHVMFGLPQGFTASTLGWSYYEFKDSFDSLGVTGHYQTIMKEFCDFFVDSTTLSNNEVTKLLVQKGNSDTDHRYWGAPENQPSRSSELIYSTAGEGASNIAADYAAALAQYYMNFPNDKDRDTYLDYAQKLYAFSIANNNVYNVSNYSDSSGSDEQAWAAAWLYLATNNDQYRTDCKNRLGSLTVPDRGHFWGDTTLGAATVYSTRIDQTDDSIRNKVTGFLNSKCQNSTYCVLDEWGSSRHNTLAQLVALVYDKNNDTSKYNNWSKAQMAFLLGNNTIASNGNTKTCFVTGFADNSARYPHHRAASGYSNGESKSDIYSSNGHTLVGALVGGPDNNNTYQDVVDGEIAWKVNEVALDYNAGLVGAAAGLFYFNHTGIPEDQTTFETKWHKSDTDYVTYKDTWSGTSVASVSTQSTVNQIAQTFSALRMMNVNIMSNENNQSEYIITDLKFGQLYDVNIENVTGFQIEVTSSGVINFEADVLLNGVSIGENCKLGWANNTTLYYNKTFDSQNISSIQFNEIWSNNPDINITLHIYYDSGNTFSLSLDKNVIRNNNTDTATLICDGEGVKYTLDKDNVALLNGNILSPIGIGTVRITASVNGVTQYVDLNVVGDLSVKSPNDNHVMGINETLQLTAENNIGDVTWAVKDSSDIVTIDSVTGMITSNTQTGEATITAMDSYDNMVAEFTVNVEAVGLIPALPNNKELVGRYEIRKDDDWLKEVNGLPYTDENGAKCYYYIVECDSDGNETAAITNNGVQYIPLSYADNGSALDEQPPEISVTNMITKKLQGTMPSTGGEGKIKYNVTGLAIMLSSSAVYYLIRRRRKKAS